MEILSWLYLSRDTHSCRNRFLCGARTIVRFRLSTLCEPVASIFISHSKRDQETINVFCRAFAQTTIRAVLEEFENYVVPPWTKIAKDVQESSAVFLLLSPHLNSTRYTQNWVSYEVGLACAMRKPVWVYEQEGAPVHFPVPYLTDYVIYNPANRVHMDAIKNLLTVYDPSPALGGLILGALIGAAISGGAGAGIGAIAGGAAFQHRLPAITTSCPYQNCGIKFNIYSRLESLLCPSCRQQFAINWTPPPPVVLFSPA